MANGETVDHDAARRARPHHSARVMPGSADTAGVRGPRVLAVYTWPDLHHDRRWAARGIAPPIAQGPQRRLGRRRDALAPTGHCPSPRTSLRRQSHPVRRRRHQANPRACVARVSHMPDYGELGMFGKKAGSGVSPTSSVPRTTSPESATRRWRWRQGVLSARARVSVTRIPARRPCRLRRTGGRALRCRAN